MTAIEIRRTVQLICILTVATPITLALSGCVAVGYSSRGGWFVWPGGLGLLVIVLVVLFLLRRPR